MKKIIFQPIKKEIEFDLPCYIRLGDNRFYKILNEKQIITISTYEFSTQIEIVDSDQCNPFGNNEWEFTTSEEFQKAFNIAFVKISELSEFPNIQLQPATI